MNFGNNGTVTGTREWVRERIHEYDADELKELMPRLCEGLKQEDLLIYSYATIAIHNRSDAIGTIGK